MSALWWVLAVWLGLSVTFCFLLTLALCQAAGRSDDMAEYAMDHDEDWT